MSWLSRNGLTILGAISFVPPLFKFFGWLISRGGDADFIISRSQEPGWVSVVIGWITNPPGWSILPLILVGLVLIWWDAKWRPRSEASDADHADRRRLFELRLPRSLLADRWPDYDKWDQQSRFRLFEAACLWSDCKPSLPMGRRQSRTFQRFRQAIYNGTLTTSSTLDEAVNIASKKVLNYTEDGEEPVTVNTTVSRDALVDYAKQIGERPRFLFVAERG